LWVFTRGTDGSNCSPRSAGARIGIGAPGSGCRCSPRALLEANGITGAPTTLVEHRGEEAGQDFLAANSTPSSSWATRAGRHAPLAPPRARVQVYDFTQADGLRAPARHAHLHKNRPPARAIDLGRNLPRPTLRSWPRVELVARRGLNSPSPTSCFKVAQQVHGKPNLFAKRTNFPRRSATSFRFSGDALRFYKSAKPHV